jgi:hypothetical protein
MDIPMPFLELLNNTIRTVLEPNHELTDFVKRAFIAQDAKLYNEDHLHLEETDIAFLFTNIQNVTKSRRVIAQVEEGEPKGRPWVKAKKEVQIRGWFERIPDYIVTIDAVAWMEMSNNQKCAVLEHELYHIQQKLDEFQSPMFYKDSGLPILTLVGHDVEEFIGVVERYGAFSHELERMKQALNSAPELSIEKINGVCGNCMRKVA